LKENAGSIGCREIISRRPGAKIKIRKWTNGKIVNNYRKLEGKWRKY